MKKLLFIAMIVMTFAACEKSRMDRDRPCPQVNSEDVSQNVKESFSAKYEGAIEVIWFNRDNKGFSAVFTLNAKQKLAHFNNDGSFKREVTDFDGDEDEDNDCGCEIELEDED